MSCLLVISICRQQLRQILKLMQRLVFITGSREVIEQYGFQGGVNELRVEGNDF